jgi:hypothetical protein
MTTKKKRRRKKKQPFLLPDAAVKELPSQQQKYNLAHFGPRTILSVLQHRL